MTTPPVLLQPTPKTQLLGMTLASGWTLVDRLEPTVGSSGGTFGVGYKATRNSQIAFVKAIDFVDAINAADPLVELSKLTGIANFEKEVLEYCAAKGMSKVLRFIGHEYVTVGNSANPLDRVSCLIMEAGEEDLRRLVNANGLSSCSWNLLVMRDVSQAIAQLHRGGIAHQDIKPSNVISVQKERFQNSKSMKVGDLGRVVRRDQAGPFDSLSWPGDLRYSPPERWYDFVPSGWGNARDASDAYMLGSLLIYLFTATTLQSLVANYLPLNFHPGKWTGSFDEDLLPILIDAHARVIDEHLLPNLIPEVADEVVNIARNLTHPDPRLRGDAKARRQVGKPIGMDRIHQKFVLLSLKCAAIERGRSQR